MIDPCKTQGGSLGELIIAAAAFPALMLFPTPTHAISAWRPVLFFTVGLFLLLVARSLEELAYKL